MSDAGFRHLGGGRKGLFLLLRYLFIIAASYLLIFLAPNGSFEPTYALMIAAATWAVWARRHLPSPSALWFRCTSREAPLDPSKPAPGGRS
jgi:hypothetical protein